jgi:excisionase family DNA binding protein
VGEAEDLLTIAEAAELLGISRTSMYRLVKRREIGFTDYPGSAIKVSRRAVDEFVARHTVTPAAC